jgi:hypothetical protein
MIRHGRKARSTGVATTNAGLCKVDTKYVAVIKTTNDVTNTVIFFLALILELHDIIISSYVILNCVTD